MKKFKYTLDSDLTGVPFEEIFLVRKFGLEYELELAIFDNNKPVACNVYISSFKNCSKFYKQVCKKVLTIT